MQHDRIRTGFGEKPRVDLIRPQTGNLRAVLLLTHTDPHIGVKRGGAGYRGFRIALDPYPRAIGVGKRLDRLHLLGRQVATGRAGQAHVDAGQCARLRERRPPG